MVSLTRAQMATSRALRFFIPCEVKEKEKREEHKRSRTRDYSTDGAVWFRSAVRGDNPSAETTNGGVILFNRADDCGEHFDEWEEGFYAAGSPLVVRCKDLPRGFSRCAKGHALGMKRARVVAGLAKFR